MRKFGLIGKPLTHSFSKKYFEEKFEREQLSGCRYRLFELQTIKDFPLLISSIPDLIGLNVTIPYKESVIAYLHDLSAEAKEIGAVNCIKFSDNRLIGYNTDYYGFEISLTPFLNKSIEQAFILGSGGSSKAVEFVLNRMDIPFVKVSRNASDDNISYNDVSAVMKSGNLFINTTPLGMFPDVNASPDIPYHLISKNDFLFDLIYNPAQTEFLKKGKAQGAQTKNGLEMLELQAGKSWEIWNS
ncbi:MAG TPA: shikimate dehydrogenase [Chitinophagales bacterium]|nr:shikimate dehydrogenase [Chitinophagales bacterium]